MKPIIHVTNESNSGFLVNNGEEDMVESTGICSCGNYKFKNVKCIQKRRW